MRILGISVTDPVTVTEFEGACIQIDAWSYLFPLCFNTPRKIIVVLERLGYFTLRNFQFLCALTIECIQ